MRGRIPLVVVAAACTGLLSGCGVRYPLPTETLENREYSTDKSYDMISTWVFADSVADILLTQGSGSQLFILFSRNSPGQTGTAPRGDVFSFALRAEPPTPAPFGSIRFQNLFVPSALCQGQDRLFVLDEGDTCLARRNPLNGTCDSTGGWPGRITDLSTYWRVREYDLLGGDTISTFTDTSMAFVRGVAADAQGRVYVAGSAIALIRDEIDPRIITRTFRFQIHRYLRVTPGSAPPDPYMPGTNRWIRDTGFLVDEGSGIGTVFDPRGIHWGGQDAGAALFVADFGKNWVQKLSDASSSTGYFKIDEDSTLALDGPVDVTSDQAGFIYLTDTRNQRVLRYDPDGGFVQRVDVELDSDGLPLSDPIALAADNTLVYVCDGRSRKVICYQRRQ